MPPMWRLGVIATVAGAFSGLFGVGGGSVMGPLLVLWVGYGEREATGTSLAAIPIIGTLGAIAQGLHGTVDLSKGLLIGFPAVVVALFGSCMSQRVPRRAVPGLLILFL